MEHSLSTKTIGFKIAFKSGESNPSCRANLSNKLLPTDKSSPSSSVLEDLSVENNKGFYHYSKPLALDMGSIL